MRSQSFQSDKDRLKLSRKGRVGKTASIPCMKPHPHVMMLIDTAQNA